MTQRDGLLLSVGVGSWALYHRKRLIAWQLDTHRKNIEKTRVPAMILAENSIRLGRNDEAFGFLEKADDKNDPGAMFLKVEPRYDSLRDDPRYAALLGRIGLTP